MLIAFAIQDDSGAPVLGAAPAFSVYCDADGAPAAHPSIEELGGGLYGFSASLDGVRNGRAFLVATGHNPAFIAGSLGRVPLLVFAIYDAASQPLAGAAPSFSSYVDSAGAPLPAPSIIEFGGGLYGFQPTSTRAAFALTTGAEPPTYSGTANPEDWMGRPTPPTLSDFAPPPGSTITRSTALAFTLTDDGEIVRYYIAASFAGHALREVVHDGQGFAAPYSNSTREVLPNGSRFTIRRNGDWPAGASPTLHIEAIDEAGNVSVLL